MGSGKTSMGRKLAKQLHFQFVDTDEWIEEKAQKSVSDIFLSEGESVFRAMEHDCFLNLLKLENTVVSTGGGLPCHHDHMQIMNDQGLSIYLEADPKFLASRLIHDKSKRPLIAKLKEEDLPLFLENLLKERRGYYEKSQIRIASKNLRAMDIIDALKLHGIFF